MEHLSPIILALIGTTFTFLGTAIGSALVFFTKKEPNEKFQRFFLGFAAGVMIAATVFSLLIPSIEMATEQGQISYLPSCIGILLGAGFIFFLDKVIPHQHINACMAEGPKSNLRRPTMLMLAVTLHNIPEGMAVGLTFAMVSAGGNVMGLAPAIALAVGMAVQNLPEGAAISLPFKNEGFSKRKSFMYGALSGIVEPIAGVIGVAIGATTTLAMPWLLAFAGGAMMYVVFEELIPESQSNRNSHIGTIGALIGFVVMMVLDIALG